MPPASKRNYREELTEHERQYWRDELDRAGGNICEVCRTVNVNRPFLYKRLATLGIKRTHPAVNGTGHRGNWAAHGL